ncbi:hypothetical protein Bealeia1_01662 [Candidatus Bealeia paramacronuclearis]|uniref:Uncharacterized protein n=1 Tax=Candidatus Bealeia paramacronuclearis TaxID=1921001 RepID=A0ABZ2C7H7_9PROT|nr:hypothetical protein [Candidatus Bealeia paramacronuclearis]
MVLRDEVVYSSITIKEFGARVLTSEEKYSLLSL